MNLKTIRNLVPGLLLVLANGAAAIDPCNCKGHDGPGGPAHDGPGGPCYAGPGGTGKGCPAICKRRVGKLQNSK